MPPKPGGRGSSRARGGARGGEAAARATESASEATEDAAPQSTAPAAATEPIIPKQEDGDESTPPVPAESDTGAEAPARAPVQRLGSLQGSVPPSRSASPSVRGRGSARGKRGTKTPVFTGRRSKEERDAIAKEQAARDKERSKEQVAADKKKEREAESARKREARQAQYARGGYSGALSGPFSLGSSREDRKNNSNRGYSGFGSGSGSRAERVKTEGDGHAGSSYRSGGGGGGGGGGSSIKREGGGFVSSDDEPDEANVPRRDIDLIEISSDEDESNPKGAPKPRGPRATLPVRIGRKEHQERTFGINTDASSETAAKILEQAETTSQPLKAADSDQTSRKAKGKAKDVEITGSRKQFKGVWHDSEDLDVSVKVEAISDDEKMADAEPLGPDDELRLPAKKEEPQSPDAERKPKAKKKGVVEPVFQTEEDRAEWERIQANLRHVLAELGPEMVPQVDGSGDVNMAEATAADGEKKPTVRDNNVYIVQFPPLMPELLPPTIKNEPSEPLPAPGPSTQPQPKPDVKVKLEEGGFSDPAARTNNGVRFESGRVGKLRVHKSGRTTLDWGGTSYELKAGQKVGFLQEVSSLQVTPENLRDPPEDAGEGTSLGRVKGKFVVMPDWGQMLG
ncbi:hypothetical protein EJ02DRAFT_434771 [Clathrospora elynae]|uniref:DNA-directed RNA polymerase III RPC4 n=1 Tax=Clathrospora elynae TaxID=706981 RepID=A0A6A5SP93_9PLEO|nr:hypothetical protein EJ02DRAFT_434771 [Clathrospora elynae]